MDFRSAFSDTELADDLASAVDRRGLLRKAVEAGVVLAGATVFFAVALNGRDPEPWFVVTGVSLLAIVGWTFRQKHALHSLPLLVRAVAVLALALWTFCSFRALGWAAWPMARPAGTSEYVKLFYMQFVLAITIGAFALWAIPGGAGRVYRFGRLRDGALRYACISVVVAGLLAATGWMVSNAPAIEISIAAAAGMAVSKAALLAFTEEIAYRGVLLQSAASRWGASCAIVFQAAVFAAFHAFISPVVGAPVVFVFLVFALGLFLGWTAWRTQGIGWAWLCHTPLALVAEWQNLS